jgi:hypothetical protein
MVGDPEMLKGRSSFTILRTPSDRTRVFKRAVPLFGDIQTDAGTEMQLGTIAAEPHLMDPARAGRYLLDQLLPEPAQ